MSKGIKCKLCGERGCLHMEPVLTATSPIEVGSQGSVTGLDVTKVDEPVVSPVVSQTRQQRWRERNAEKMKVNHREYMRQRRASQ